MPRFYKIAEVISEQVLKVIQKYLGHSSLQTTMVYLHLTDTAEANAREEIEKLFDRLPGSGE